LRLALLDGGRDQHTHYFMQNQTNTIIAIDWPIKVD
jgi:hypothetical protein